VRYGIAFSDDGRRLFPIRHNIPYETIKEELKAYQADLNARDVKGILFSYVHMMDHTEDPAECNACVSAIEEMMEREKAKHGGTALDPTPNQPTGP